MIRVFALFFFCHICSSAFSQPDLTYFLPPTISYNPAIPTPKSIIGHEVGEWHITHDRLVTYMKALDAASDRITLKTTGFTHEGRPLLLLTITAPENHANLETIRQNHLKLSNSQTSVPLDVTKLPLVFYVGFSIHGNEASGANAGLIAAYHLAAATGPEIESYLRNTIILFDPSYNPDGLQRFSTWVNSRKSQVISTDPNDTEHNEAWPGGRFNHYWFDLNRDWLVAQHPESQARIKTFHEWKPNVLTDHHEMGTNATFFFQPGVPSRMHPLTPAKNLELTRKIGEYHAKALDEIGSLYYTQEGFDDFYYGKGSTFPDIHGAIGILFEQASSRGHAQESTNGVLRFEFTIRNQFTTVLSSLKAVNELRPALLDYQRQFYKEAQTESERDPVKSIVFGTANDPERAAMLANVLTRQDIKVEQLASPQSINGKSFSNAAFVVSLNQPQYRLIKSIFEKRTRFQDSLFYDISSWTLPLAFGLEYEESKTYVAGTPLSPRAKRPLPSLKDAVAVCLEPGGFYTPKAMYRLLHAGYRIKGATESFNQNGRTFPAGSILIPLDGQEKSQEGLEYILEKIATEDGIEIHVFNTGLDYKGVSLGSSAFVTLKKPVIAMVAGDGFSATDVGEIWHLLDTRYRIPVSLIPPDVFNRMNLNKYTHIIIPPGSGNSTLSASTVEKLKPWVNQGGILIGFETALNWFNTNGLGKFEMKKDEEVKENKPKAYADIERNSGAQETSGAIMEAQVDLTNPLFYGYITPKIPVFKGNNLFLEPSKGSYSNPMMYGANPLLSGYISKKNYSRLKNSSALGVSAMGQGRVIGFTDNLCFRAFWFGTNKILMNAIYYGPTLNSAVSR